MALVQEIILVHGLWFGPWAMKRLERNFQSEGFRTRRFAYRTTGDGLESHAVKLREFARESTADRLHFASHSLGGLVTLNMLNDSEGLAPGRVILLGSPLGGSVTARRVARLPGTGPLFGQIRPTLESGYPHLPEHRETGLIAGSRPIGLGMLMGKPGKHSDGTVAIEETRVDDLKDHLVLPVTHTGMLYSRKVAHQAAMFLQNGHFEHSSA